MSRKLLLADDSITIQKVIGITFANEDYQLTVVDNGDTALQKARLNPPDLILADVFMPGKNGYELCAAIKGDAGLAHVPVLLLSGTFEPFDEQKAREAGADSWISKPFESQALIERVEGLLNRPRPTAAPLFQPLPVQSAPVIPIAPPLAVQPQAAAAPAMAAAAATPLQPAWDDSSWRELEPAAAAPVADSWQDLEEASAVAGTEDDFSWEEPFAAAPEEPNQQVVATAAELPPVPDEEDLWGSVSFGDEELLGQFGVSSAPEVDDLWGSLDEEAPDTVGFAAPPPAPVPTGIAPPIAATQLHAIAPVPVSAPAFLEWEDDQEILPLDELEILEEEDILDDDFYPAVAAAETTGAAARGEDLIDPFAVEEDGGLALQQAAVAESSFAEDAAAEAFAMADTWEADAARLGQSPVARELLATSLNDSDWSHEVSGGDYDLEDDEEFLLNPVEVDYPVANERPAVASAGSPVTEEQVDVYLKEADIAALVEKVAGSLIERLAGTILERIAWEIVPDLAENLIKDEIRRIKEEVQ
jgi:CheY-like chemotaxis protein